MLMSGGIGFRSLRKCIISRSSGKWIWDELRELFLVEVGENIQYAGFLRSALWGVEEFSALSVISLEHFKRTK
jgi:hypothetical protein